MSNDNNSLIYELSVHLRNTTTNFISEKLTESPMIFNDVFNIIIYGHLTSLTLGLLLIKKASQEDKDVAYTVDDAINQIENFFKIKLTKIKKN